MPIGIVANRRSKSPRLTCSPHGALQSRLTRGQGIGAAGGVEARGGGEVLVVDMLSYMILYLYIATYMIMIVFGICTYNYIYMVDIHQYIQLYL